MANDDQTATPVPAPAPQEGFLHSLASSLGADPETIKATVRAIIANPKQAFSEVGHEIADEAVDAISHPKQTLKDTTTGIVQGVPSLLPNPEAAKVAQRRLQQPGLRNKLTGVRESLEAAVPMAGAGLVKGEEQSAEGNDTGALGTAVGTLAPFVIGGEAAEGGEAAKPDIFTAAGGRQVASAARVHSLVAQPEFNAKIIPAAAPDEEPAEGLEGLKFSTDPNGIKWAENKDGVRVSIPKKISSGAAADYAKTKINEQAAMQKQLRASISPKLIESAGATQVTPPEPEAVPYHPDLQKIADKYGTSYSPKNGAGFITPDGKFIDLPYGMQHPEAIAQATGEPLPKDVPFGTQKTDNRIKFLNDTQSIRMRLGTGREGQQLHVSVPSVGVTPEQIGAIQQAVGKMGRTGNLIVERADITAPTADSFARTKEFASPRDVEPMLKQIGAHPDQRAEAAKPAAVAAPEAKPDVYELNADEGEETPAVAPNKTLQASAQKYATAKGMEPIDHSPVEQDPARATRLARTYHDAADAPNDPKVAAAYDALKKETKDQFHHLRDDLGLKFEPQADDPYTSAGEMMNDVQKNNRLKVFTGSSTGESHPLSEIDPETGHSYNTLFRWVHDAMGHAAGGFDFSENGEKSATEAHAQMYSDKARPAMRAETEGQTSWFFHNPDVEAGTKAVGDFAPQKATLLPDENNWHQTAGEMAAKNEAGGIDPRTGKTDATGKGVEIMPELRQPIDHAPTAEDFQKFYEQHQEVFDKHPELRVGWDNNSAADGGHEINVGAVGDEAARVAKKLDQKSAFDIEKGENIDTKGSGLRTEFPNYPLEDRMKDLRGENQSDVPQFEHLSRSVYDNLEPDERKYLEGNKTLQRNVMQKYHELQPSVEETTNAMQAGAALGGWWKRYIDIFHGLADEQVANTVGPSHAEVLKQVHAALSANKPVNQANNIAWSFYADWLDEGKPTDRKSIDTILKRYGAEKGEREGQTGNASITDTYKRGKVVDEGLDTSKIYHLVNSPEMRGERPFHNDVFSDDANKNPLMGPTKGARKIPSMGATVAGKGNLNRLVIDTHIRDFYGQKQQGSAPQYIADSAHLRQAAKALGLQGGEGQEQLWGTVLGLKYLLKEGLTPPEAAGTLSARVIHQIGKDYAEVISNDPDITKQGGILDRLKEKHGIGGGSAGFGETYSKTRSASAGASKPAGSQAPVSTPVLGKTATRIRQSIPDTGIKKLADSRELFPNEGDTSFNFGANER